MNTNDKAAPVRNAAHAGEHVLPQDNPRPGEICRGPCPPAKKNSELPSEAQHPEEPAVASESLHLEGTPPGVAIFYRRVSKSMVVVTTRISGISGTASWFQHPAIQKRHGRKQRAIWNGADPGTGGRALQRQSEHGLPVAESLPEDERLKQVQINGHRRVWESQLAEFLLRHTK